MAKIIVIDSGVLREHSSLAGSNVSGIHLCRENGKVVVDSDICDMIGHGTAVVSVLNKLSMNNEIFMIKIFEGSYETDPELLVEALQYVYENVQCDIIHMSLGLTEYSELDRLETICKELSDKGVVLISAYDNYGSISFPAAFDCVVGVDTSQDVKRSNEYIYVENSCVNVFVREGVQRVAWIGPEYMPMRGTSFATPYLSAIIANAINTGKKVKENIQSFLKENAMAVYNSYDSQESAVEEHIQPFVPSKMCLFPFNKEMHSIVRFAKENRLDLHFFDAHVSGKVRASTSLWVKDSAYVIKDIDEVEWGSDFDTFVIGHCDEVIKLSKEDYKKYILEKCVQYHKNVFAFDDLSRYKELLKEIVENGNKVYYPKLDVLDVPNNFGKMYYISKPVLAVCGTSSSQGKFTLQCEFRRRFSKSGFVVGQVGTEPSSFLFGHDATCAIGYGSTIKINEYQFISAVNKIFFDVAQKENDIIITGTQSGTIPYNYDTVANIPVHSLEYLMAIKPDGVVLCVNPYDDVEYIARTIKVIEGLYETNIIAIAVYPLTVEHTWETSRSKKRALSEEEKENIVALFEHELNKLCFCIDSEENIERLYEVVLNYFIADEKNKD